MKLVPPAPLAALVLLAFSSTPAAGQDFAEDPAATFAGLRPYAGTRWSVGSGQEGEEAVATTGAFDWSRPDAAVPISVLYGRVLEPGQWEFGYRYSYGSFDGLLDGRDSVSNSDIFGAGFTVASEEMTVQTHTFEALYGYDDHWTFFGSLPYVQKDMDLVTDTGTDFDTDSNGIGDLLVGAIYEWIDTDDEVLLVNVGLSLPTGSTDETDDDATGSSEVLPYVMQLGDGTVDLHPGVTWVNLEETWSWGVSGQARFNFYKNSDDWSAGDTLAIDVWASKPLGDKASGTVGVAYFDWSDYHGQSDDLDRTVNPLNDAHRQGGQRLDLFAGAGYDFGTDRANSVEVQFAVPVDEWLDGPGLENEWTLLIGWHGAW